MRKPKTYLFLLCSFLYISAFAQDPDLVLPDNPGESVILNTDRDIYGVGEQIFYFASYRAPAAMDGALWSNVMYVELISWDGSKQAASKVLINNGLASGNMRIPGNLSSGVYYLRAYTLWMRNYSSSSYVYLPLRILNPYNQELLASPANQVENLQYMEQKAEVRTEGIRLNGLKDHYGTGEAVDIEIEIPADLREGSYSLGIAKTLGLTSLDYLINRDEDIERETSKIEFLPEINGRTLSGSIIDNDSGQPVEGSRLQLSSYADPFYYAEVLSGIDGKFLFTLPHFTGNPELNITEASDSSLNHSILLASEFCNKPVSLPFVPLLIDTAEQSIVSEILVNMQLMERYGINVLPADESTAIKMPFYGKGASVTYVRDYIELPDLREFIYEIIPQVSIQGSSKSSSISIQGPSCLDIYPPLILVDNVPVPNNEAFLNIPSNRIERIEVVNHAYMVGNSRYSGIISIYSSKKDMTGMSQEGERNFFNLRLLDGAYREKEDTAGSRGSSFPDVRNLLFLESALKISTEGLAQVHFRTPDSPGTYVLTLRGVDQEKGSIAFRKALISVK